jgi:hypothetical protein
MQIIIKDTSSKSLRSFRALHSAISKLNKNVKLDWGCRSSAAFMGLSLPRDMIIYLSATAKHDLLPSSPPSVQMMRYGPRNKKIQSFHQWQFYFCGSLVSVHDHGLFSLFAIGLDFFIIKFTAA